MLGMLAATIGTVAAATPYLAVIGPPALRFNSPPSTNRVVLPPLPAALPIAAVTENPSVPDPPPVPPAPPPATEPAPAPTLISISDAADPMDAIDTNTAVQSVIMEPQVVTPSLLLKYFTRTSNGPVSELLIPSAIGPLAPAFIPPSKATYSTVP